MGIEFFGEVDKNSKGVISSDLPSWLSEFHLESLEEEVAKKKRQLDRQEILPENAQMVQQEIKVREQKIRDIKKGKPKLVGGQKTKVANEFHALKNKISDTMPTVRDDKRGFVNPRDELKRLKDHHIQVDPEMAAACNVKHVKGKITGDGANRMYKIMAGALGENDNIEKLRKEGRSESMRSMDELTARVLEKLG